MSYLSYLMRNIKAEETNTRIILSGFNTHLLFREIKLLFGSRPETGIVYERTGYRVEFPKFFAFDFRDILLKVIEYGEFKVFKKETVLKIVELMEALPLIVRSKTRHRSRLKKENLNRLKKPPLKHQNEFFEIYDQRLQQFGLNGYILAAEPGTGKTMVGYYISEMLEKQQTIVFSPSNALGEVWLKTRDDDFWDPPSIYVYNHTALNMDARYLVFSHDNMKFAAEMIKRHVRPGSANVVIDECHNFNDMKSDRTLLLIEICLYLKCEDVLFMSGTPFKAFGAEILPFLHICDSLFSGNTEQRFKKLYGTSGNSCMSILAARIGRSSHIIEKKEVFKNPRVEIELQVEISNGKEFTMSAIRKKMQDFIKERVTYYKKVGPIMENRYLELVQTYERSLRRPIDIEQLRQYRVSVETIRYSRNLHDIPEVIKEANAFERKNILPFLAPPLRKEFRDCRTVYKYVALKIQGEALGRILGKERERCNVEILRNLNNAKAYCEELELKGEPFNLEDIFNIANKKVIFFTDYVGVIRESQNYFKKEGFKPVVVYGETNKDLIEMIRALEKDPTINPAVATYKSLSTAVPLTMCDVVVFLNAPFREYIMIQAESRIDRLGQDGKLKFFRVFLDTGSEPNISTRSKDILSWSKEMVETLLGVRLPVDETIDLENMEDSFVQEFDKPVKVSNIGW